MKLLRASDGAADAVNFVGLDTTYYISQISLTNSRSAIRGAASAEAHGAAGWNGRKSGRDFMITPTRESKAMKF